MKAKQLKIAVAIAFAVCALGTTSAALAQATNVQLSTGCAGTNCVPNGIFDLTAIQQFDWQSSGDLVVKDALAANAAVINGSVNAGITTFASWVAAANASLIAGNAGANTVSFSIFAQTRLNDLLNQAGGSLPAPGTLDKNGAVGGDAGFEITAALNAVESARMIAPGVLQFTGISGTYSFFFDNSPNSDVILGTGFINGTTPAGTAFLSGNVVGTTGTATFTGGLFSGNSLLTNTITFFDPTVIKADPASNGPLIGSSFDTLIKLANVAGGEAQVGVGGTIGLTPYTVLAADLRLKADANSAFSARPIPEPGTMLLAGAALMGLAACGRRRKLGV